MKKPNIHVENGLDIHQGDNVLLKCTLVVPKNLEDNVQLQWLKFSLDVHQEPQNLTKKPSNSPGYTELELVNRIPNIENDGPFRLGSSINDVTPFF